jgi:dolichol-phosphate mannosyltransferase
MTNRGIENFAARIVLVIPSYNESEALEVFLRELLPLLPQDSAVIIADDSIPKISAIIQGQVDEIKINCQKQIIIDRADVKTGRGAAVKRGMRLAVSAFPNLEFVVECDADGSHTPKDVMSVILHPSKCDLVIGSRYLPQSKISNWPLQRKIFSKILNMTIPRVLDIPIKDITNGLRRYSMKASALLVSVESMNSGFVYLSEQASILQKARCSICETPIHFINRVLGESTVTSKEVIESITGIKRIIQAKMAR